MKRHLIYGFKESLMGSYVDVGSDEEHKEGQKNKMK
jgi:hypothetical protein